jgi:hypothetical protein
MDTHLFYIIDPLRLGFSPAGMSLQQRRDRLGELVRAHGAEWSALRMRAAEFMAAVEKVDRFLGAGDELTNSAFENSPGRMLTIASSGDYEPLFGYYEVDRVRGFQQQLRAIPTPVTQDWENGSDGDIVGQVVYAFRSTFAEAARRARAVVLEHR